MVLVLVHTNLYRYFLSQYTELNSKMEAEWGVQQQENEPEAQQQAMDDDDSEEDILDMGEDEDQQTNDKQSLLMRFCPNDSSMLYPEVSRRNTNNSNHWICE